MSFITEFVESPGYKKAMGKVYGFGAAIVLAGALFKIMHYPGAGWMLLIGMGTEIVIFSLSAFEPPHETPDWSLVYPELRGLETTTSRGGSGGGSDLAALIDTSDLFIGGSTGPTHIAGSLQKRIIAFYSKIKTQSPIRWGVFNNPNVKYIQPDNPCKRKFGCSKKCKFYDCFDKIDLVKTAKEIIEFLENN